MIDKENNVELDFSFVDISTTFAILTKKQFVHTLKNYEKKGKIFDLFLSNDFGLSVEDLIPKYIFHKNNEEILYDYDIYVKTIKAFNLFGYKGMVGFYYCKTDILPLFVISDAYSLDELRSDIAKVAVFAIAPRIFC